MDFLVENWPTIIAGIVAILAALKLTTVLKYVSFAKEVGDIYVHYKKSYKDGWTDEEKIKLADEVIEAAKAGKVVFSRK